MHIQAFGSIKVKNAQMKSKLDTSLTRVECERISLGAECSVVGLEERKGAWESVSLQKTDSSR